jgi:class 3 adenylate cyclase/tetratricopeptide (TPR) repeat protein
VFIFDNCSLDTDRRELKRGADLVAIEPQVFDVLLHLIRNRDRVVSRDDLLAAVWRGRIVSESTLSSRINAARVAIGDSGNQQRLIRTIARKGFRFVGEVRQEKRSADRAVSLIGTRDEPEPPMAVRSRGPERRHMTIMICSIAGLTDLSARLDPEDLSEAIGAYHACIRGVVELHNGFVADYMADGALAYFGYPQAHEGDAERAVRAALAVIRAVSAVKIEHSAEKPLACVSIATGLVLVGDLNSAGAAVQHAVVGETPLLAARLLALAAPGAVVVSASTRRLVGDLFDCHAIDIRELDGTATPAETFHVLRESGIASRFDALHRWGSSPLIGREEELGLLTHRWEQAAQGAGRVVLITGEAGIGKSRLTNALQDRLASEPQTQFICHCSPHHQDSALHPIIGQLVRATGIEREDGAGAKLGKLEALLGKSSANLAEDVSLLAALLSIPGGDRYPLPNLTPQRLKERTLAALIAHLKCLAARQPLLMVFEDLHWIDPTSLELLCSVVDQAPDLRLLFIATFRPEFAPPWAIHRHISTVSLSRLGRDEGQSLVAAVTKGKTVPHDVVEQILDRADGVPLFIEELTKTVLESDLLREVGTRYELVGLLAPFAIPSTLHASLLARLDRLGSVKDVAQIGAVIGREFPYDLIAAISALPEQDLQAALAQLVGAEVVFQRGTPPDSMYLFKHALVQETAYASLVRSRRQQLHGHIARTLEERCSDIVATEPEIVAYHFTEAGLFEPAVDYWGRAGDHFVARSAYNEAIKHFSRAIELLRAMPQTPETLDKELETCVKMGPALFAMMGAGSTEAETIYLRALELVDLLKKKSLRFAVLWGLWYVNLSRAQYTAAREIGERLLDTAQSDDDAGQLLEAHHALWATLSAMGHAAGAMVHMERGIALYNRELHASQASLYGGHDPGACCRYHLAVNLWLLGYSDQSLRAVLDVLRLTEELKHPATRVIALWYVAWVYYQRGDQSAMRASLEQLLALAAEHGISALTGAAIFLLNIDACCGKQELAELHGRLQATWGSSNWHRVFCLCVLAERYKEGGHVEDGLAVLASISPQDRGAIYAPEILRLEGELRRCLPSPDTEQIEHCIHAALILARQRAEKSLELRAAMSLSCFWRDQGRRAEARELLKPIHDWFTEGVDLRDLKNARALLDELARAPAGDAR